jgi:hypothetical protein
VFDGRDTSYQLTRWQRAAPPVSTIVATLSVVKFGCEGVVASNELSSGGDRDIGDGRGGCSKQSKVVSDHIQPGINGRKTVEASAGHTSCAAGRPAVRGVSVTAPPRSDSGPQEWGSSEALRRVPSLWSSEAMSDRRSPFPCSSALFLMLFSLTEPVADSMYVQRGPGSVVPREDTGSRSNASFTERKFPHQGLPLSCRGQRRRPGDRRCARIELASWKGWQPPGQQSSFRAWISVSDLAAGPSC